MTAVIKDNKGKNGNSSHESGTNEAVSGGEVTGQPKKDNQTSRAK